MPKKRRSTFKLIRLWRRTKRSRRKKTNWLRILLWIIIFLFFFLLIPAIVGIVWFKKNILATLPDISKIETIQFAQTTVITDRNWQVLYKLFEQNRKYVTLDQVSKNLINAVVATEDKNFWTNPWIDVVWLIRAAIYDILHHWAPKQWWSTITQQLIKNLLLTPEKTIVRKLKEIVLAIQLNDYLKEQIKKQYSNLPEDQIEKKIKEKILEIYLNYIFLWNNAYWVEAAAETYFWKSAKDLNILESAIIASLPKAPSYYDPVKHPWRNLWYFKINDSSWNQIDVSLCSWQIFDYTWTKFKFANKFKKLVLDKVTENIKNATFTFKRDELSVINFLKWLLQFDININWKIYSLQYVPWRKDIVLARMYVDGYIDSKKLKDAIIEWFKIKIKKSKIDIKAPHFVFFILDYLKKKYWEELLLKWWLTIKTTLDLNIQNLAEQAIRDHLKHLHKYWANNAALIYADSQNWDILAYVGSVDYNSGDIDWQVDMIQALRQPWSTIKPFVYSLAFIKFPFTIDQPIYDTKVSFGYYQPNNVDWRFLWLLPLKKALAYSRNIPAIKLLYLEWLKDFVSFINKLWVENISLKKLSNYWLSLAIWAAEVKMYNWAQAFAHLSALWKPAKFDPILEIRWPDWTIIYKKQIQKLPQIIPSGVAYLIWKILSDKTNFPPSWRPTYTRGKWIIFATKSWTTNVKLKNWKKLPRDWWFVAYTPSKVMVFWAWNTKWEPMKRNAYGWWLNSPIWKEFVDLLKERGYIRNEEMPPVEIKTLAISKLTWKLPSIDTPLSLIIQTIWYIANLPSKQDDSIKKIQIDKLCNWKVSQWTPKNDIWIGYVITPEDVIWPEASPENYANVLAWWRNYWIKKYSEILNAPVFLLTWPNQICEERQLIAKYWKIKVDVIKPEIWQNIAHLFNIWYNLKWPFVVKSVKVYLGDILIGSFSYNTKEISDIKTLKIPDYVKWDVKLKVVVEDEKWYKDEEDLNVNVVSKDEDKPKIYKKNISRIDWKYKIVILFEDSTSGLKWWEIGKNWKVLKKFDWNLVSFEVEDLKGLKYKVEDFYGNASEGEIKF